jgi:heme A synthase
VTATVGFVLFLLVTLALLGGVVATGLAAKRRLHLPLVVLAVASLGVTIFYAEQLGREYDLEAAGWITPVHLTLAKITTLAYLLPIATGIATIRDGKRRPMHRKVAFAVLALTVLTAATGTWMILASEPLSAVSAGAGAAS